MISGQIEARPLAVLLYHLYQQQFTGEIAVQTEGGSAQIYLTEGAVVQILLPQNQQLLGQVLRDAGVISDVALRRALATPPPAGQRLGDVLLALGLCDENRLLQGLRLQIGRRLGQLLLVQRGGYLAVPGPHQRGLHRGAPLITPTPWTILFAARTVPLDRLKLLLGYRLRAIPRLLRDRDLAAFGLDDTGTWLVKALKVGGHGVDSLVAGSGVSAQALLATLYAFHVTEVVTFDEPASPPPVLPSSRSSTLSPPPPPPPSLATPPMPRQDVSASGVALAPSSSRSSSPSSSSAATPRPMSLSERALLALEIEQRSQFIAQEDPFSVLGVMEDADSAAVESAFVALTDQYAVERLVQLGLNGLVGHAGLLVQRFHEAYEALRTPATREQQRRRLAQRTPQQEEELHKARARLYFSRGVVLLRNREFALSIPEFRAALRLRPQDGELIGHLAWAEYGAGMRGREECRQRIISGIERAPEAAPLYYFAGVIFKVEGDEDTALRCFAECCKRDPRTQAAASELRILLMRKVRAAINKPSSQSSARLAPSSQSAGPKPKASSQSTKPPSPSSQSYRGAVRPPSAKSTPPKPSTSEGLQALLGALKEATATAELLQLWQRAERELSAQSRDSSPPLAPSSESQHRGPLGFLRRILAPTKSSSSTSTGGSKSSTSHPTLAARPRSSASSQSLPAFLSGMTPTPLSGAASTASQVLPASASSASLPPGDTTRTGQGSSSSSPSASMNARNLLERLHGPVTGNLKAVLSGASSAAGRSTETVRLQGTSAPSSRSSTPAPLPPPARPPRKGQG